MIFYRKPVATILFAFFLVGCFEGAPRRHPLDPRGENFLDEGALAIQVTNFYPPRSGLAGVKVRVSPGLVTGETDPSGMVIIPSLSSGSYTLNVAKDGFAPQESTIDIKAGETKQVNVQLAGLPEFVRTQVSSIHIRRWFPPPDELFSIEFQTEIQDHDGLADIDSVWIDLPDFDYSHPLSLQTEPGHYAQRIPAEDLPVSIQALYGREFFLIARDRSGATNSSEPLHIIRVISPTPLALSPEDLTLLSNNLPEFTWEPISLAYPFTYRIDIVRVDQNIQSLVQTISDIPSTAVSIPAGEPLTSGEYFWTVSIVDEFGNLSRSREAGFRIP